MMMLLRSTARPPQAIYYYVDCDRWLANHAQDYLSELQARVQRLTRFPDKFLPLAEDVQVRSHFLSHGLEIHKELRAAVQCWHRRHDRILAAVSELSQSGV
eukprot:TRINITY_DN7667_c0_g1_i2.p4 TRINITY_DN7667_c0_g1~~TRINITY_DN7667_c0_g1_i2.p4  ORF type:complete len:101 (+),score=2.31 TRINITY_DN7667_c0_g1_i2:628-930(+)